MKTRALEEEFQHRQAREARREEARWMDGSGDVGQTGVYALAGVDWSFVQRTLLDKPTVKQACANPLVKQLIAVVAQMRCSAHSHPARIARR